jgi:hypothetical protein
MHLEPVVAVVTANVVVACEGATITAAIVVVK